MKDQYSKHKLLKHLDRLSMFDKKGYSYPIYADFDLTNNCNNNCPLCCSAMSKNGKTIEFEKAKDIILQLKDLGIKSITLAGGGDPTCHPNLEEIIKFIKELRIDVAIITNGYLLSDSLINTIIANCTWMRISLDADSPEMYKKTHGMDEFAFNKVLSNIKKLTQKKKEINSPITIGTVFLLGPHTIQGIYNAAKLSKDLGVDYIRFRPFEGLNRRLTFEEGVQMFEQLNNSKQLTDENFKATFREDRVEAEVKERKIKYPQCLAIHFIISITPDLKVYPCCNFRNNPKYCLGDLNNSSLREIWLSEERKKIHEKINLKDCPNPCQFEKHNEFLFAIKNKGFHENFL